jgi:LuxR family transcriptional regulator, maltose regulon positive regulatory protein
VPESENSMKPAMLRIEAARRVDEMLQAGIFPASDPIVIGDERHPSNVLAERTQLLGGTGSLVETAVRDGWVDEALAAFGPTRNRSLSENHRSLGILLAVGLAMIMAIESESVAASNEFRQALSLVASAGIRHMTFDAGPEISALLADLKEFADSTDAQEVVGRSSKTIADTLSPREIAILDLIGQGRSNKEIARQLGISPETVKTHVKNMFSKLEVDTRAQAVLRAHALGLIGASAQISMECAEL